jgi:hypothetical protein
MGYFKELPNIEVVNRIKTDVSIDEKIIIKNFFKRAKIREDISSVVTAFEYYQITENETPSQVAEKVYGEPELDWVILTTNNIINVQDDWPIDTNSFNKYLLDKYGSESRLQEIHHYETLELKDTFGRVVLPAGLWVDEAFYNAPEFRNMSEEPPGITFPPILIPGTIASASAILGGSPSDSTSVVGIASLQPGLGYDSPPTVTFSDPAPSANASVNASVTNFIVSSFNDLVGGQGYLSTPIVTISPPLASIQATASCEIDPISGGVITITELNGGSGYGFTAPTVTFTPPLSLIEGSYLSESSIPMGTQVDGMFVSEDGFNLYTTNVTGSGLVKQFSLSTAWNVNTLTFIQDLDVSADFSFCTGIEFKPDGTRMFVVGGIGGSFKLISYNLSTPWDISTATILHQVFVGSPGGIRISPNGLKLFFLKSTTAYAIEQYNLSTAWNINTISVIDQSINVTSLTGESITLGFSFASNGLKLLTTGESTSKVYEFKLTSPYNLDNVTLINDFYIGDKISNPSDIFVKPDESTFFICGGTENRVFQYEATSLAKAIASLTNGTVTNINITQPGIGYTETPIVTVAPSQFSVQATAVANVTGGIVTSITLTNGGSGYIFNPSVSITPAPISRRAFGIAILNGTTGISSIAILDGGANYTSIPTITFDTPDEIRKVFAGDTYSQNNKTWRWNGTQWQEQFTEEFQYLDPTISTILKTRGNLISVPVTNYEYEQKINNEKRSILILKPTYLSLVVSDLRNIMKYDSESSTYINDKLKSTYNPKFTVN